MKNEIRKRLQDVIDSMTHAFGAQLTYSISASAMLEFISKVESNPPLLKHLKTVLNGFAAEERPFLFLRSGEFKPMKQNVGRFTGRKRKIQRVASPTDISKASGRGSKMTDRDKVVLVLQRSENGLIVSEVVKATGIKPSSLSTMLWELERQNRVQKVPVGSDVKGPSKYRYFAVTKETQTEETQTKDTQVAA